jgi:hypothetical protein
MGPALKPHAIGVIDAVLLSHDQQADNLDNSGRAFRSQAPRNSKATPRAWRHGKASNWRSRTQARFG